MSEQNRWEDERAWDGAYGQTRNYSNDRGQDRGYREREPFFNSRRDSRYADRDYDRSSERGGYRDNPRVGYGLEQYGIPADYTFGRDNGGHGDRDRYDTGNNARWYGQGGGYYENVGYGYGRDHGRDGDFGADRRHLNEGRRPAEDRSFWSQTRDEVSSWFGDDEAIRRRQADELRAGQHRGRGPKGYTRSDDRIREDVSDRLTDDYRLDASDIEVTVNGAEVTLGGTVQHRMDKRRAEDLVDQVFGVKHVQNNLRVKEPVQAAKTAGSATGSAGSSYGGQAAAQPKTN